MKCLTSTSQRCPRRSTKRYEADMHALVVVVIVVVVVKSASANCKSDARTLEHLELANNKLTSAPLFERLLSLQSLDLSHNAISQLPTSVGLLQVCVCCLTCQTLRELNLAHNSLIVLDVALAECRSLPRLDVSPNLL